MSELPSHYVYRREVIEFLTVAAQICAYLEQQMEEDNKQIVVERLLCLLPMLYLKARMLEKPEEELEGDLEQFCTEEAYNYVQQLLAGKLGTDDTYLDVMVENSRYTDEPVMCTISENVADIYQELRDLCANYQTQEPAIMNDAVCAVLEAFELHWGQKLLNALRALHVLACDPNFTEGEEA